MAYASDTYALIEIQLCNDVRRAIEWSERARHRMDSEGFIALIELAALARLRLRDLQRSVADDCAPWFEVRQ